MVLIPFGFYNMGVPRLVLCVLYQIYIISSCDAIKLPSIDQESTAPQIKPLSTLLEENGMASLSSPINPKLKDAILQYFKSKYLGISPQSSDLNEHSSPLVVTSSSRVVPLQKIEAQEINDSQDITPQNGVSLPVTPYITDFKPKVCTETSVLFNNMEKFSSLPNTSSPKVQNIDERIFSNGISLPSITTLPTISSESLKKNIESLSGGLNPFSNHKINFEGYPSTYPRYDVPYPLRYNQLTLPDVLTPSDIILPNLNPINKIDGLTTSNSLQTVNSYLNPRNAYLPMSMPGLYSPTLASQTSIPINGYPDSLFRQRVPTVPLVMSTPANRCLNRQQLDYLNQPIQTRTIDPVSNRFILDTIGPIPYLKNFDNTHIASSLNLANPYYPPISSYASLKALPEPIIPKTKHFGFMNPDFTYEASPFFANNLNSNIDFLNNVGSFDILPAKNSFADTSTLDCNTHTYPGINLNSYLPEIPNNVPSFIPIRELPYENRISDISSWSFPTDLFSLNNQKNIRPPILCDNTISEICSSPTINYASKLSPTSVFPSTYINTSPNYPLSKLSSNAISSLNEVVSTITQSILTSFISCLTSATIQSNLPACTVLPNPYCDYKQPSPSLGFYNNKLINPNLIQSPDTYITLPLNTHSVSTCLPLVQLPNSLSATSSLYVNVAPSSYDDDVCASTSDTSSPPLKVTLLPPTTFIDYVPLQPCPSTLPSPAIPSYLDMIQPLSTKPQFLKYKTYDRKTNIIEKLLELVYLAEFIHGEGYIDWDALDTVLAILCAS